MKLKIAWTIITLGLSYLHPATHRAQGLVRRQCLRRNVSGLAHGAGEVVLQQMLLDALVAEALSTALDDDGISDQLLA